MKTLRSPMRLALLTVMLAALIVISHPSSVIAQGSLTPPGAPTPTMKTLDQIEARTLISSAPYTISAPGSYYLTRNLTVTTGDAITINATGVSLNLNGFTITSTAPAATGAGIRLVKPNSDITILNGHILGGFTFSGTSFTPGPGFQYGIFPSSGAGSLLNVRVTDVSVSGLLIG